MAKSKRLGVYWGETGFSLVELSGDTPGLSAFVSFVPQESLPGVKVFSGDLALLDVLQKTIRNKGFSTSDTFLSLPSKDILIRWFTVPLMNPVEIQNVVSFEAKKYIPFDIDELSYTYYPMPFVKDKLKQLGIIFVAIRKDTLEHYTNVLVQSGLKVGYSEPAAMSLVRALVLARQINMDQVTAILQTSGDSGELIITSKGHVKFTREFKVQSLEATASGFGIAAQGTVGSEDVLKARIFSEARLSFEFFSRQYGEEDVNRMIILSPGLKQSFWDGMNEEMGIPVDIIDPLRVFNKSEFSEKSMMSAFGAAMAGNVATVIDFNLSEKTSKPVSLKREEISRKNRELVLPVLVGIGCSLIIAAVFFFCGLLLNDARARVTVISSRIGPRSDMAQEELEQKVRDERKKLDAWSSLPDKVRMTPLMVRIVGYVPEGMVLENISVTFEDSAGSKGKGSQSGKARTAAVEDQPEYVKVTTNAKMTFSAYAYLNDNNAEFNLIVKFVNSLREDPGISAVFKDIQMSALKTRSNGKKKVTGFMVTCEDK